MMQGELTAVNTILGVLGPIGILGLFAYIRGIKADVRDSRSDMKDVAKDLKEFKNGHYKQHMDESYARGQKDTKIDSLHRRVDDLKRLVG